MCRLDNTPPLSVSLSLAGAENHFEEPLAGPYLQVQPGPEQVTHASPVTKQWSQIHWMPLLPLLSD
jgi:hypothetical protein